MITRTQIDLKAIAGDDARVEPLVAVLEGGSAPESGAKDVAAQPAFVASGKQTISREWAAPFTASGKASGKSTGTS